MAGTPETLYAKDGDAHVAYWVVGEGPDILFVPTATFPIDLVWDEPTVAGHLRRLASFSRLILTDLLGTGSSDAVPIHDRPAMQAWTDGFVAVLDAVGTECASIFAMSESALPAMLLTASHPQRVRSLVLFGAFASYQRTSDQPFGMPGAGTDEICRRLRADSRHWPSSGDRIAVYPMVRGARHRVHGPAAAGAAA
jgi:pimeloyl-ACP methyl ester carboxylesterase